MIKCKKHGVQPSVHVSRDLSVKILSQQQCIDVFRIDYEYVKGLIASYYVTKEFAEHNNLTHKMFLNTPEKDGAYPLWTEEIIPVCDTCFNKHVTIKE